MPTTREADHNRVESQRSNRRPHRDPGGNTDDNKLDPAVIPGDTKKQQPTIIKINTEDVGGVPTAPPTATTTTKNRSRSRANSSSSSSNNNPNTHQSLPANSHPRNGEWIQHQETQQRPAPAAAFNRNTSARSSRSATAGSDAGGGSGVPPPRPYKSPELTPYANLDQRAWNNPKNQVLPSPGGSLPSSHRAPNPTTNYATVMSNSKLVEYNEKRVNGEIVSQSVHKQERMNQ